MDIFNYIIYTLLVFLAVGLFVQKKKLKKKDEDLALIFNRISDAVISVDSEWKYTFLNDAALATHPLGREETLG